MFQTFVFHIALLRRSTCISLLQRKSIYNTSTFRDEAGRNLLCVKLIITYEFVQVKKLKKFHNKPMDIIILFLVVAARRGLVHFRYLTESIKTKVKWIKWLMNNLQLRGQLCNRPKTTDKIFYTRLFMIQNNSLPDRYSTAQSSYHTYFVSWVVDRPCNTMDNCCTDHYKPYLLRHVLPYCTSRIKGLIKVDFFVFVCMYMFEWFAWEWAVHGDTGPFSSLLYCVM